MITKYKLEIESNNELLDLPIKREHITESQAKAEELIQKLINNEHCMSVNAKLSFWDDETQDWYLMYEKVFYESNTRQDYMLLCNGAHEIRNKQTWMQEFVIHLPTKITFFIDDTEKVSYAEDLLEDPEVLFYKFKYTTQEGKIYRFTLYCNLRGYSHTVERLEEIKETILKPGAKWFCNHLREKYRMLFNEDPYFNMIERQNGMKGV